MKTVNEEIHQRLKPKQRIHPIEWVLIGALITICGFMILYILEGLQWLLF